MEESTLTDIVNGISFDEGRCNINIHPARQLQQFSNAEEAIENGYIPIGIPISRPISILDIKTVNGNRYADLRLGENDIPDNAEAYVASGIDTLYYHTNRVIIINAVFYKKRSQ